MTDTIRVLLADDEDSVRNALAEVIGDEPRFVVVGHAHDAEEAIALTNELHPEVVVLDVRMPCGGGPRAAREISVSAPETNILALSAYDDRATVLEMLSAGANGYVVKGSPPAEILDAVHRAADGHGALSGHVAANVIDELAQQLEREAEAQRRLCEQTDRIESAFAQGSMRTAFQPIVDLRTGAIQGVEALARFELEPRRAPDVWFAEADAVGRRVDLEMLAVRLAGEHIDHLPPGAWLSLNVSPEAILSPAFERTVRTLPADRLVIEITEHAAVSDYDRLIAAVAPLRAEGGRIAVDDAGAGWASLRHILALDPDMIKLDLSLTRDIDHDRRRRALAAALISFATQIGADIVAEGIETVEELDTLRTLGVVYGQGFFLARPSGCPQGDLDLPPRVAVPGWVSRGSGDALVSWRG